MSGYIYFNNAKKQKKIKFYTNILILVYVVFSGAFLYLSQGSGIEINNDFYKKSPAISSIEYKAVSNNSQFDIIKLKIEIDESFSISVDDDVLVISNVEKINEDEYSAYVLYDDMSEAILISDKDFLIYDISFSDLISIALQTGEKARVSLIPYFILTILFIASLIAKSKIDIVHKSLFNEKVLSQNFFKAVDFAPFIVAILSMIILFILL